MLQDGANQLVKSVKNCLILSIYSNDCIPET